MYRSAIIYSRVSTDEQADRGYSLRDQEVRLREYCARMGIDVVRSFVEDASAKSFDRPEFGRLLKFVRQNRGTADVLLVVKWDRFSRNTENSYAMIGTLRRHGVEVQAIEQQIDWSVPEQYVMAGVYLTIPEVENRRRSLATVAGMRRAMKEGRWVTRPPFGYRRSRDEQDKAIIVPDEKKASYVREAFRLVFEHPDVPLEELRRRMNRFARMNGITKAVSRSNFLVMLQNPVYQGVVRVSAYQEEREQLVDGLHEPLVSASLFERVQRRFVEVPKGRKWQLRPELQLRGHLLCPTCSNLLTGSGSKGNGGRYWYYHCHRCGATRYRAEEVHDAFLDHLNRVQFPPDVVALYREVLKDLRKSEVEDRERRLRTLKAKIGELEEKLFSVDEAYIEKRIEADSYARLKERYQSELRVMRSELDEAEARFSDLAVDLECAIVLLSDLAGTFERASLEARKELLVRMWPDHLTFEDGKFRTNPETDLIALLRPESPKTRNARGPKASGVLLGCPTRIRT